MIGRTLSHYHITGHLGAGGMGEVYLAEDTKLKRKVALKVLPADLASDPRRLERFQREAEALAALSHPNIITIYSIEDVDGVHFITMDLVEGEALTRLIPLEGVDVDRFYDLALPIVDAMAAAHDRGITHRDIKPANIVVGVDGRLRVLDFGLAKVGDDTPYDTMETMEQTRVGVVLGTIPYMSPEQVQGLPVDHRSDIFSMGVTFYVMLTGRQPFNGATSVDLASSILKDHPSTVTRVSPNVPDALSRVIQRCLEKSREARYQQARDLLIDLQATRRERQSGLHRGIPVPACGDEAIAVLPFQNMSPDPENEYFSDGITEEIINALAQIDGLRVAARTSSFSFKGKSVEIGEVGARLNVGHVLEGSVRKAGNRVRITAQLIEASSGYQLWAERYDRQIEDIFDVQDDIARTIVERLKVALVGGSSGRLVKVATANMEAYQHYLKGRAMLYKRGPWILRALESFKKAVDLDPNYAPAWAGLADAHMPLGYYGYSRPEETMPQALEAAKRAIAADPECAEAHCAIAGAALMWERNIETAEREFLRAIALNPTYTQARCWYGLFYLQWTIARVDEGVEEVRRALHADPLSSYATMCYTLALTTTRRHEEAIVQGRLAVQRDAESFPARWALGNAYRGAGRFDESIATCEAMLPGWGRNVWVLAHLAITYGYLGDLNRAKALHEEILARRAEHYVQPMILAISASGAGDLDAAIGFCEEGARTRDPLFPLLSLNYAELNLVRADPRFADIASRFNRGAILI